MHDLRQSSGTLARQGQISPVIRRRSEDHMLIRFIHLPSRIYLSIYLSKTTYCRQVHHHHCWQPFSWPLCDTRHVKQIQSEKSEDVSLASWDTYAPVGVLKRWAEQDGLFLSRFPPFLLFFWVSRNPSATPQLPLGNAQRCDYRKGLTPCRSDLFDRGPPLDCERDPSYLAACISLARRSRPGTTSYYKPAITYADNRV